MSDEERLGSAWCGWAQRHRDSPSPGQAGGTDPHPPGDLPVCTHAAALHAGLFAACRAGARSPPAAPWDGGIIAAQAGDRGTAAWRRLVCLFSASFGRQPGQAALGGAVCSPSTVGGAGPAPAAPSLFPLPRAPSELASLCCLFLAASEPLSACSANARRAILCPFDSLTAAMAEGEDLAASRSTGPALCRSDQGILMPEPHPPESCPGKRILLLNSLLGVFVSTPLCSPSCS